MLQQPLARRVAGAARYAAAGEALPGALPLSSMRRRARGLRAAAVMTMERQLSTRVQCQGQALMIRASAHACSNGR